LNKVVSRFGRLLVVCGLVVIIVAFVLSPHSSYDVEMDVMPGEFKGILIFPSGAVDVQVLESDVKSFSIYFLSLEDSLKLLQGASLDTLRPLIAKENVTEFMEVVTFTTSGTYAIMVTPAGDETISVRYFIQERVPPIALILIGVWLVLVGIGTEFVRRILVKRFITY
jgi:cytochrome c biogenesis factor